jgi:hypothetical protein
VKQQRSCARLCRPLSTRRATRTGDPRDRRERQALWGQRRSRREGEMRGRATHLTKPHGTAAANSGEQNRWIAVSVHAEIPPDAVPGATVQCIVAADQRPRYQ